MNTEITRRAVFSRLHCLALLSTVFMVNNIAIRLVFLLTFPETVPVSPEAVLSLGKGIINDLATLPFVLFFPSLLLLLPTTRFLQTRAGTLYITSLSFLFSSFVITTSFAEFFFWDEFGSRFNFIAVDYLIYTTEVIRNIIESYPLVPLCILIFFMASATTLCIYTCIQYKKIFFISNARTHSLQSRVSFIGALSAASLIIYMFFSPICGSQSRFWNEYAKNGLYELFSAYRNNQLDYRAFYKTMDTDAAFSILRGDIRDASADVAPPQGPNMLRAVDAIPPEKKPNVVVVVMESMGSKWFGEYTPNLTALANEGLSFTNMMSTGTRTVRGLEAIMLSIPPTPGNSIVRRPDNGGLFNLGSEFRKKGYDLSFLYGGIGFFDNMNAFFAANNYQVTDKLGFDAANTSFSNAWGQCDEDLYAQALMQADTSYAAGKPFQQVLLTTSNHRPFTYPEGKVSLKSGSGRRGAVQYADYAIGEFIKNAKQKPWFDNTIFVFAGDHPSSIAGKTEVPATAYGVVCIMYGPRFFKPETVTTLCSQIDIAPTLLASLGWGYTSQFFGTNARTLPQQDGRAWISTYQLLGLRTNDRLALLRPTGEGTVTSFVQTPPDTKVSLPDISLPKTSLSDAALLNKAVASYQCAYDLFTQGKLKERVVSSYIAPARLPAPAPKTPQTGRSGQATSANSSQIGTALLPFLLRTPGEVR